MATNTRDPLVLHWELRANFDAKGSMADDSPFIPRSDQPPTEDETPLVKAFLVGYRYAMYGRATTIAPPDAPTILRLIREAD